MTSNQTPPDSSVSLHPVDTSTEPTEKLTLKQPSTPPQESTLSTTEEHHTALSPPEETKSQSESPKEQEEDGDEAEPPQGARAQATTDSRSATAPVGGPVSETPSETHVPASVLIPADASVDSSSVVTRPRLDTDSAAPPVNPPAPLDLRGDHISTRLQDIITSPHGTSTIVERSPGGRYVQLSEKLGSGASKEVYRAYDTQEGIEVAWNVVHLAGVPKSERSRIVNEVLLLERLHHQNIISFHGSWVNREKQQINFVTEILSSGTLQSFINKVQVIRWKIAKRWATQILKGLEYLHSQDPPVIHRDLKCENIFINGTSGDLRIGDLGLSTSHRNGKALSVLGTPEFMAPDMYEEIAYDEKVDIYAFGMCLLEIFTKEIPYRECSNPAQIYKKVIRGDPPDSLRRLKSHHAREFIELCLGTKDGNDNYIRPSATELLAHPFLQQRPADDDVVEVDPPMQEGTIREAMEPSSASAPAVPISMRSQSLRPADAPTPSASSSPLANKSETNPVNFDLDSESDRFEDMPDSETNIRNPKVLMGRGQELQREDELAHERQNSAMSDGEASAPPPQTSNEAFFGVETASLVIGHSSQSVQSAPPVLPEQPQGPAPAPSLHYLVAAAVIENKQPNSQPYEDDILKLVVTLPVEGQTQNVQFDFHLVEDDPVQVAKEMVAELGIPQAAVLEISETISGLARAARVRQDKYIARLQALKGGQNLGQGVAPQGMGQVGHVQQGQGMMLPQHHQSHPSMTDFMVTQSIQGQHVSQQAMPQQQTMPHHDQGGQLHGQQMSQHGSVQQMQMQPQHTQSAAADNSMHGNSAHLIQNQQHAHNWSHQVWQNGHPPSQSPTDASGQKHIYNQSSSMQNLAGMVGGAQQQGQVQAPPPAPMQQQAMAPGTQRAGSGGDMYQASSNEMHGQQYVQGAAQGQQNHNLHANPNQSMPMHNQQNTSQQNLSAQHMHVMQQGQGQAFTGTGNPAQPSQHQHVIHQQQQQVAAQNQAGGQPQTQQNAPQHLVGMTQPGHQQAPPVHPQQVVYAAGSSGSSAQNELSTAKNSTNVPNREGGSPMQSHSVVGSVPSVVQVPQVQLGKQPMAEGPGAVPYQHPPQQQQGGQAPSAHAPNPAPAPFPHAQPQASMNQQAGGNMGHSGSIYQVGSQSEVQSNQYVQGHDQNRQAQQGTSSLSHLPPRHMRAASQGQNQSFSGPPAGGQSQSNQQQQHVLPQNQGTQQQPQQQQSMHHRQSTPHQLGGMVQALHQQTANQGSQSQQVVYAASSSAMSNPTDATSTSFESQAPTHPGGPDDSVFWASSNAQQPSAGFGVAVSKDTHTNGVHEVPSIDMDEEALDDELLYAELRKLDEDFQKNMMRAKRVFDSRMGTLQRTQVQREAQHQKTLERHQKEQADFEKRMQQEAIEQNRRMEQLKRDWANRRKAMRQQPWTEPQNVASTSLSTSPQEHSISLDPSNSVGGEAER